MYAHAQRNISHLWINSIAFRIALRLSLNALLLTNVFLSGGNATDTTIVGMDQMNLRTALRIIAPCLVYSSARMLRGLLIACHPLRYAMVWLNALMLQMKLIAQRIRAWKVSLNALDLSLNVSHNHFNATDKKTALMVKMNNHAV